MKVNRLMGMASWTIVACLLGGVVHAKELPKEIVAAAVGYQIMEKLESGMTVPMFTADQSRVLKERIRMLFYVVIPEEYAGRYFMISNEDEGEWDVAWIGKLHKVGRLYSFDFIDNDSDRWGIRPKNLFTLPPNAPPDIFATTRMGLGYPYFLTRKELNEYCAELDSTIKTYKEELAAQEALLPTLKTPSKEEWHKQGNAEYKEWRKCYTDIRWLKHTGIRVAEGKKEYALKQLPRIEQAEAAAQKKTEGTNALQKVMVPPAN